VSPPSAYTVVLSSAAKRATERDLPEAVAAAVVDFLFRSRAADPYRVGRPLRLDLEGLWSARRGQYRVIYSVHDDQVLVRVVRISHRADVCRTRARGPTAPPRRALTDAPHPRPAGPSTVHAPARRRENSPSSANHPMRG
jgi:mRNA interferase RelE/StbE